VERIWNSFREKQTKKEIIPYPTCSVVATATTEQVGYGIISFFCVLAPEGMNSIVFGEGDGRLWLILI
jgi:hypothetical protein